MSTEANKAAVQRFFTAMNEGDVAGIVDAYTDDGQVWTMGSTLISGRFSRDQIRAAAGGIFDAFPEGIRFELHDMVAEGDKVAVEASSRGLHASGQVYSNQYHFLFQFRDGRVFRLKEYMDTERVTDILCGGQRPLAASSGEQA